MNAAAESEFSVPHLAEALLADVMTRLAALDLSVTHTGGDLRTVRACLERASELNHSENHSAAYELTLRARTLHQQEHPYEQIEDPAVFQDALDLNACLIVRADLIGNDDAVALWMEERRSLLASRNLAEQLSAEALLGLAAFQEPREKNYERILVGTEQLGGLSWASNLLFMRALVLADQGEHGPAADQMHQVADAFDSLGFLRSASQARFRSVDSLLALGREEEALELIETLVESGQPRLIEAMLRMTRSRLLFGSPSRLSEAVLDALGALELFSAAGVRQGALVAALLLHQELAETPQTSAATAALRIALENAERDESDLAPGLHVELGASLLKEGRAAEAVQILAGYLATAEIPQGPDSLIRANAYNFLGHAQAQEGNLSGASAAWAQAHERFSGQEENEAAIDAAVNISKASLEADRAQAQLWAQNGLDLLQRTELHPMRAAELLISLAEIHAQLQNRDALLMADKAIELAEEFEAVLHHADFTEHKARILRVLGDEDAALAAALSAADLFGRAAQPTPAARCELWAGVLLLKQQKHVEAAAVLRSALDRDPDAAAQAEISDSLAYALTELGQLVEAEQAKDSAAFWRARSGQIDG